ncbi:MAG: Light-dependent protochlorophyllide reductase, partial [uncultured Solirubrobacterales bacterium]
GPDRRPDRPHHRRDRRARPRHGRRAGLRRRDDPGPRALPRARRGDDGGAARRGRRGPRPSAPRRPLLAGGGPPPCRRGRGEPRAARPGRQQRRDHRWRARAEPGRLRAHLRGQPPVALPPDRAAAPAPAALGADADRQRGLDRSESDRLRRRHARARLQRLWCLRPEQARADHVLLRARRAPGWGGGRHRQRAPSRHPHGDQDGPRSLRAGSQHGGRGRRGVDAAGGGRRARRRHRSLLRRARRVARRRPGLRPRGPSSAVGAQRGADPRWL